MGRAYAEAQHVAAMLRRSGYPEAQAAPDYCIDGEVGSDNFYTYTVSVHAGPYVESSIPKVIRMAMAAMKRTA